VKSEEKRRKRRSVSQAILSNTNDFLIDSQTSDGSRRHRLGERRNAVLDVLHSHSCWYSAARGIVTYSGLLEGVVSIFGEAESTDNDKRRVV
jgi:hypothetical protein